MKKNIKNGLCLLSAFALISISVMFTTIVSFGSQTQTFSAEEYTNDDRLLQEDGTLSSIKIQNFAEHMNAGDHELHVPEIVQVIPKQYMETKEETAEFYYSGKEYGFYVSKNGEFFDILLVDYSYFHELLFQVKNFINIY